MRYLPLLIPLTFYAYWLLEYFYILPLIPQVLQILGAIAILSTLYYFRKTILSFLRIKPLLIGLVLYTEFVTLWMYLKYLSFMTFKYDLGIFMQILYTTLYDHLFFFATPDVPVPNPFQGTAFAVHFSPILFFVLPFYAVYPSALTLFLVQALISSSPIFIIYAIARLKYDYKKSIIISLSYLLNPALYYADFYDFHAESFIPFFFLLTTYFLLLRNWRLFYASLVFTFLIIEATPVLYMFYLPYVLKVAGLRREVLYSALLSVGFFILSMVVRYVASFTTPPVLPINPALDKFNILLGTSNAFAIYLTLFLLPVLLTPIIKILPSLPAFAWLGYGWLSLYFPFFSIYFQYNYLVLPFFYVSFIEGFGLIKSSNLTKIFAVVLACVVTIFASQPIFLIPPSLFVPHIDKPTMVFNEVLAKIPLNEGFVLTQNSVFPHLANSKYTFMITPPEKPKYVVLKDYDNINDFKVIANYSNYKVIANWYPYFIVLCNCNLSPIFIKPLNFTFYFNYNGSSLVSNQFLILLPGKYKFVINSSGNGNVIFYDYYGKAVMNYSFSRYSEFVVSLNSAVNIQKVVATKEIGILINVYSLSD
jgi:uncharacterized membrane protein